MAGALTHNELNDPVLTHARRDWISLQKDWTAGEAIEWLRRQTLGEKIIYFYVVNEEGRLAGVVPTRRLLMSRPQEPLANIMVPRVISIPDTLTVADACEFFLLYRMLAFPVVDREGKLVGVIDVSLFTDEIFNLSQSRAAQDVFQLIGVHLARGRKASAWARFRDRFPWLLCNIGGGIACAFLAGLYEAFLDSVIVLALFIPVVLALAESVSIQSMSLTLLGLHQRTVEWKAMAQALRAEFVTSILLGAACGTLVGAVAWAWKHDGRVAAAIGVSIGLSIVTACLLGVLLPTLVRALRGNPRIAAGPMVLALADLVTLLFYFNLSGLILG